MLVFFFLRLSLKTAVASWLIISLKQLVTCHMMPGCITQENVSQGSRAELLSLIRVKSGSGQVWQHCYLSESSALAEHLTCSLLLLLRLLLTKQILLFAKLEHSTLLSHWVLVRDLFVSLTVFTDVLSPSVCFFFFIWCCRTGKWTGLRSLNCDSMHPGTFGNLRFTLFCLVILL